MAAQEQSPEVTVWAKPGRLLVQEKAEWYIETLNNVKGVYVGDGYHFLEEDHPYLMGRELATWSNGL